MPPAPGTAPPRNPAPRCRPANAGAALRGALSIACILVGAQAKPLHCPAPCRNRPASAVQAVCSGSAIASPPCAIHANGPPPSPSSAPASPAIARQQHQLPGRPGEPGRPRERRHLRRGQCAASAGRQTLAGRTRNHGQRRRGPVRRCSPPHDRSPEPYGIWIRNLLPESECYVTQDRLQPRRVTIFRKAPACACIPAAQTQTSPPCWASNPGSKRCSGPTNTGKTHLAIERMLAHASGIIGFPLRLLARENYDRMVAQKGRPRRRADHRGRKDRAGRGPLVLLHGGGHAARHARRVRGRGRDPALRRPRSRPCVHRTPVACARPGRDHVPGCGDHPPPAATPRSPRPRSRPGPACPSSPTRALPSWSACRPAPPSWPSAPARSMRSPS